MELNKGKFIVIEGIDGCGKGTQTKFLSDFLSQKKEIFVNKYPQYGKPIGDLIDQWLHKKHEFNPETQALLYFTDFLKDKEMVENYLKSGKMVVVDRYFTATIVYQRKKGVPLEKLLNLAELFKLPKPDICIYLKISAETSLKRKGKEKGNINLDRHEEDKAFQIAVANGFDEIANNNTFCDWTVIDGEKTPEEVFKDILEVLNKKFGI
ncbi:MAG: dTMP kinase [Candidatus Paceibacterota bacterium]|jgi:dTMP kinase